MCIDMKVKLHYNVDFIFNSMQLVIKFMHLTKHVSSI